MTRDNAPDTTVEALGTRFTLRPEGEHADELRSAIRVAWDACLTDTPGDRVIRVSAGRSESDGELVWAPTVAETMEVLTQRITGDAITARAGDLVMLHAAALADPETGRTLVLVGPSGMGKTTAARTLATAGLVYVTDETVAIDLDGVVLPYPKPLSVLAGTGSVKSQLSPTALGLSAATGTSTLAGIALLTREPGFASLASTPVQTTEGLAYLAEQSSFLSLLEHPLHRLARVVDQAGGLQRVRYSEAPDLVGWARNLLAVDPPALEPFAPSAPVTRPHPTPQPSDATALDITVQISPNAGLYASDGTVSVFVGGQVLVLSELASAVVQVLQDGPRTMRSLTADLIARFGPPADDPTGQASVHALTAELASLQILEIDQETRDRTNEQTATR